MKILMVLGGGIGNIIQATPAMKIIHDAGNIVDLKLFCNSSEDLKEIFNLPFIRNVYVNDDPKCEYQVQLNGPFTPKKSFNAEVKKTSKIKYAQHIEEHKVYCDLAEQIGISLPTKIPKIDINIGKKGTTPTSDTVVIYPGSKPDWAMKRWDKYDKLAENFDKVVLVGTETDINSHGDPTWIKKAWNWPKNVKTFQGSLRETAYFISHAKMFIGNDGGLAHIAAATGVPTFVIFGPSSVIKNKPHAPNAHAIYLGLECQPCQFKEGIVYFDGGKATCPHDMSCMKMLETGHVMRIINNHLNS